MIGLRPFDHSMVWHQQIAIIITISYPEVEELEYEL